jgi:hypothetical protein
MATVNGNAFLVELSADSGSTWKSVVCETDSSASFESSTNSVTTKCGTFVSAGEKSGTAEYNGVVKSDPAAGELSYAEIAGYWKADTSLKFRAQSPSDGTDIFVAMDGTVTSVGHATAAGEFVTFSWSFTCSDTSTIDFTP